MLKYRVPARRGHAQAPREEQVDVLGVSLGAPSLIGDAAEGESGFLVEGAIGGSSLPGDATMTVPGDGAMALPGDGAVAVSAGDGATAVAELLGDGTAAEPGAGGHDAGGRRHPSGRPATA